MLTCRHVLCFHLVVFFSTQPPTDLSTHPQTRTQTADFQLSNEVDVSLEVDALQLFADIMVKISEESFFAFPVRDYSNLNCWLATIPMPSDLPAAGTGDLSDRSISLSRYQTSANSITVNVSCVSCSSPDFDVLLSELYTPGDSQEEIIDFFNVVRDYADQLLGSDFLDTFLDETITDAGKRCPHHASYDPEAAEMEHTKSDFSDFFSFEKATRDKRMASFNIVNGIVASILFLSLLAAKWYLSVSNKRWRESLSEDDARILNTLEEAATKKETAINASTPSLFQSRQIPTHVRWGVPLMVVFNIGLYIGGHWGLLSYVDLEGQLAGEPYRIRRFLEFTFFAAASNTYSNGGNEMAIFLFVFSGIWPYIKLLLSLVLWFTPPRKVSTSTRGSVFLWLDVLTKLSVIDVFMMLIVVAAVLVYVGGRDNGMIDESEYYSLKLLIVPGAGFYSIMMAQRISRVSSRFFLDYHDKVTGIARREYERANKTKELSNARHDSTAGLTVETTSMSFTNPSLSFHNNSAGGGSSVRSESNPDEKSTSVFSSGNSKSFETCDNGLALFVFDESRSVREDDDDDHRHPLGNDRAYTEDRDGLLVDENGEVCPEDNIDEEQPSVFGLRQQSQRIHRIQRLTSDDLSTIQDSYLSRAPPKRSRRSRPRQGVPSWSSDEGSDRPHASMWLFGRRLVVLRGSVALGLAGFAVIILMIIGFALAPSSSLEIRKALGIAVESGNTFEQAVEQYNVFRVVCLLLVETRVVLQSTEDYVGLGILLFLVVVAAVGFTIAQVYNSVCRLIGYWKQRSYEGLDETERTCTINRLKAWHHMEVYVIAFVFASWQLGAIAAYVIHYYCDIMRIMFDLLSYIGLVKSTTASCFRVQLSDPTTLGILLGAFSVLLLSFLAQAIAQFKKNKASSDARLTDSGWVIGKETK